VALAVDAVTSGSRAVERIQKETVGRPLALLERVPGVAPLAAVVHVAHDVSVSGVHAMIRGIARAVGAVSDVALEVVGDGPQKPGAPPPGGPP